MGKKISVVIHTLNEEANIERAITSVSWADEVVVCDMHSEDKTVEIAKKLKAKVVYHKREGFVEPARNFAISQTLGDWVLILDADEEIPQTLAKKLQGISNDESIVTFVEIPRKNILFGKWMVASMWWPDLNIRFFKKGSVTWSDKIHSNPDTTGQGFALSIEEDLAIIHHHYTTVTQFIERMNRYTTIQATELKENGYKFKWLDLINKPLGEFLGRFFANQGFKDGLHGLALSFLQAFSFLVMYLKLWELEGFNQQDLELSELKLESQKAGKEIRWWFKHSNLSRNPLKRFFQKAKDKTSLLLEDSQ